MRLLWVLRRRDQLFGEAGCVPSADVRRCAMAEKAKQVYCIYKPGTEIELVTKRLAPTGLQRLIYGPGKLGSHCHLWKNAREGGILATQQAITHRKHKYINLVQTNAKHKSNYVL